MKTSDDASNMNYNTMLFVGGRENNRVEEEYSKHNTYIDEAS